MKIENNTVFVENPKVVCRVEYDENYTVYNPDTDVITTISPLSKSLMDMFDGENSVADVHYLISEIYSDFVTKEGKKEFLDFLKKLLERGIIGTKEDFKEKVKVEV